MKRYLLFLFLIPALLRLQAQRVRIDAGSQFINGVWLVQDLHNEKEYFYIPQYPRLSLNKEGNPEFLLLKYNMSSEKQGGILHMLFEFTLLEKEIEELQKELRKKIPGAKLVGPVNFVTGSNDTTSSFTLISSVLNAEGKFSAKVQSYGRAPVTPGSKVAVSADLSADAVSLFESSMNQSTSDLSVVLTTAFVGHIKSFDAKVTARSEMLYSCFKKYTSTSITLSTKQINKIIDSLYRSSSIKIESTNSGAAYGDNNENLEKLLSYFTNKVIDVMFDAKDGWAKEPEKIILKQKDLPPPQLKMGIIGKLFGGVDNLILPSHIYTLKQQSQVSVNVVELDMNKSTAIKVPIVATGNISALQQVPEYREMLKGVFLESTSFESSDVYVQVSPEYQPSFDSVISHAIIEVEDWKGNVTSRTFTSRELTQNGGRQKITLFRNGSADNQWKEYKYNVTWYYKNPAIFSQSNSATGWVKSNVSFLNLSPPIVGVNAIVNIENSSELSSVKFLKFEFLTFKNIKTDAAPKVVRQLNLRIDSPEINFSRFIWVENGNSLAYRISYTIDNQVKVKTGIIKSNIITHGDEELSLIKLP